MKIKNLSNDIKNYGWMMFCEGCNMHHRIPETWTFNNDYEKPTFTPSVKHTTPLPDGDFICHYNITNGMVIYHNDCTHHLAGKTVTMKDINDTN